MNKIFMLSLANIRKTKGHTVSLVLMFLIAAALLNAGLLISVNFGSFFEKTANELKASDVYYIMPERCYNNEIENYLKKNSNVETFQKEDSLLFNNNINYNNSSRECTLIINSFENNRNISKWKFMGEHLPADNSSAYVPYVLKVDGGYKLNDTFKIDINGKTKEYTIKGFIDDTFFSSLDTGIISVYVSKDAFMELTELSNNKKTALIFANLKTVNKDIENDLRKISKLENSFNNFDASAGLLSFDLKLIRLSRVMMASIVSIMMVVFAAIIVIVCLIVVRFRIGNSIEEDMTKIGSLKAIGYTSGQIISSIVLQFSIIAFAGTIIGIFLSYFSTPTLSDVFAHQSGLMWVQGFDPVLSTLALFFILLFIIIVSFVTSRHIIKLNPIVALRGGLTTHSFKKNHLPLDKSKGALVLLLSLKSIFQNIKQSLMICIIISAISFANAFAVIMFYNTTVDTDAFKKTPGIEISDVIAVLNPKLDNSGFIEELKSSSDVVKTQFIDEYMVKVNDYDASTYVMDDYSQKETNTVYEGRYPIHNNEVALAGHLAEIIGKKTGDTVEININGKQADFIITGLTQGSSMGGMNMALTHSAVKSLNPDFRQKSFHIYLKDKINVAEYAERIQKDYKGRLISVVDMQKRMEQGMGIYTSIVSQIGLAILAVTILIVILVLYFVINSSVIRRKRELGIQKAIGFTTFQLMNQLSIGFLPPIILGVFAGSLLGIMQTNGIMSVAQRGMGIMKANFIITPEWIALFGFAVAVLSYLTAMLITFRIRKISAYALVSE